MFGNVETKGPRHPILLGAALGLLWGMALRAWMRFISTDPEFTWSGTGYILGAATIAGLGLGWAWTRRQTGKRNWWRLTGFLMLPLGMGAGAVMLPSLFLGAMAFGRKQWPRAIRVGLVMLAVGFQVWVFTAGTVESLPGWKLIPAFLSYGVLITLETKAFSIPFLPSRTVDRDAGTPALQLIDDGG